jgi:UDP-3-O-[3-hydroxymyristoyl] N-acetylglucosamine deacetylase
VLVKDGVRVATVEHLMSAFAGLGIDNAYRRAVEQCRSADHGRQRRPLRVPDPVRRHRGADRAAKRFIRIRRTGGSPRRRQVGALRALRRLPVSFEIDFDHPVFKRHLQSFASMDFSTTSFLREISRARTFGFMRDIEIPARANLGRGGSLDNAIVLDDYRILNEDGLRYENEFVRHKILDAIGDLYLLGHSVIGEFSGYKSGHGLNNLLLRTLLEQPRTCSTSAVCMRSRVAQAADGASRIRRFCRALATWKWPDRAGSSAPSSSRWSCARNAACCRMPPKPDAGALPRPDRISARSTGAASD